MKWSDIRKGFPNKEIHLFGAGVDSGTYDYFTQAIVGKEHSSRGDYTSSEDDNVLVQGVARDPLALGGFGYAYVANDEGDGIHVLSVATRVERMADHSTNLAEQMVFLAKGKDVRHVGKLPDSGTRDSRKP